MQCPKCAYEPTMSEMQASPEQCPGCGVYYAKVAQAAKDDDRREPREAKGKLASAWHGAMVSVQEGRERRAEKEAARAQRHSSDTANSVVVVDIKMSFWSMVVFMVKWAIAAIPALIILAVIFSLMASIVIAVPKFFEYKSRAEAVSKPAAVSPAPNSYAERIAVASDPGSRYAMIDIERAGSNVVITTRRDGKTGTSFARRFVDCRSGTSKYLATSDTLEGLETSPEQDSTAPTQYGSITYYISRRACEGMPTTHSSLQ